VREEALGVPEEPALALDAPRLLQERQGQDLGIREALYGLVAVVDQAEKHDRGVFRSGERLGMVEAGHLSLLVVGSRMARFSRYSICRILHRAWAPQTLAYWTSLREDLTAFKEERPDLPWSGGN